MSSDNSAVSVCCRIRPENDMEVERGGIRCLENQENSLEV